MNQFILEIIIAIIVGIMSIGVIVYCRRLNKEAKEPRLSTHLIILIILIVLVFSIMWICKYNGLKV